MPGRGRVLMARLGCGGLLRLSGCGTFSAGPHWCDICEDAFPTSQALGSHRKSGAHKAALERKRLTDALETALFADPDDTDSDCVVLPPAKKQPTLHAFFADGTPAASAAATSSGTAASSSSGTAAATSSGTAAASSSGTAAASSSGTAAADGVPQSADGEWNSMAAIGILAVLAWCVGFGLLFARAIWRAPQHLHDENMRKRWRFLFIRYRPDVHWWALVFVAKGVLLNLGSTLIISGIGQVYWIVSVLLGYTLMTVFFRPWRHVLNSSFDVWVNLCLFFTCVVIVWSAREPSLNAAWGDGIGHSIMIVSFFVFVIVPTVPIACIMVYRGTAKARMQRELDMERIYSSVLRLSTLDREDFLAWLQALHERDFWVMMEAMYLIQTELARNKCRPGYSGHELRRRQITLAGSLAAQGLAAQGLAQQSRSGRTSVNGVRYSQSDAIRVHV